MKSRFLFTLLALVSAAFAAESRPPADGRFLYVAVPASATTSNTAAMACSCSTSIGHTFVRRIPAAGRNAEARRSV